MAYNDFFVPINARSNPDFCLRFFKTYSCVSLHRVASCITTAPNESTNLLYTLAAGPLYPSPAYCLLVAFAHQLIGFKSPWSSAPKTKMQGENKSCNCDVVTTPGEMEPALCYHWLRAAVCFRRCTHARVAYTQIEAKQMNRQHHVKSGNETRILSLSCSAGHRPVQQQHSDGIV